MGKGIYGKSISQEMLSKKGPILDPRKPVLWIGWDNCLDSDLYGRLLCLRSPNIRTKDSYELPKTEIIPFFPSVQGHSNFNL